VGALAHQFMAIGEGVTPVLTKWTSCCGVLFEVEHLSYYSANTSLFYTVSICPSISVKHIVVVFNAI
jgi:hypothetical protein